jgi:hypothetical protein
MKLSIGSRSAIAIIALTFTGLLLSCGPSLKVTTDHDSSVNLHQYHTFSLYKLEGKNDAISELNANRINAAVKSEMVKKGFTENTTSPELLVNTIAILKDRQSVSSNTDFYGYGGAYRPYAWGGGMGGVSASTTYNVENYKDGSLIIDIVEAASKKLIWQGTGNSEIDKPLKDPDTQIPAAVTKIMASFPGELSTK